ncbi:MAG: c-type cytochrome biogenesis protein CcmI [Betaproteobacteria bacterium]|nr:c-type cytochrome biogenesis protein CcmI [Betaproteobacteria bacterium]
MAFWLVAGGMTLAALAFVLARLVFPRRGSPHVEPREANLAALRAPRAELDRDLAAGLLSPTEHGVARDELARRAAEELDEGAAPVATRPSWVGRRRVVTVLVPAAAFAFYAQVGSPMPSRAPRLSGRSRVNSRRTSAGLREQLAKQVAEHPKDGRAWVLLARVSLAMDRFPEAEKAFEQAVKDRKVALDAAVWCDYADAAGLVQGGKLEGSLATLRGEGARDRPQPPAGARDGGQRGRRARRPGRRREALEGPARADARGPAAARAARAGGGEGGAAGRIPQLARGPAPVTTARGASSGSGCGPPRARCSRPSRGP